MLQLARLEPALRLAAGAVADERDVSAIRYYVKLLDQLDRYQPGASTPQAYDDAARERLYDKMGRIAARLQAKTAKKAAGPPRLTEPGDPMREGEAGFNPSAERESKKSRLQAPQVLEKSRSAEDKCFDFLPVLL